MEGSMLTLRISRAEANALIRLAGRLATQMSDEDAYGPALTPPPSTARPRNADAEPLAFQQVWQVYPKRAGGNPKAPALRAYLARVKSGVSPADLLAGVRRYAAFITATGKENTEYVKQAASFFGPDAHWAEPWTPPTNGKNAMPAPYKPDPFCGVCGEPMGKLHPTDTKLVQLHKPGCVNGGRS